MQLKNKKYSTDMYFAIIGASIAFMPFVYDIYGNTAWGHCFTIASTVVAIILGVGAVLLTGQKQANVSIADILVVMCGIYLAISTVATKNDVLATNVILCSAAYLLGRLTDKRVMALGIGLAGVAQAVLVIAQWANLYGSNHALFDVTGSFGNPAQVAGFIVLTLFATVYCTNEAYKSQKRGWAIGGAIAIIIQLVALFATSSRAAWVGVIAAIVWAVSAKLRPITRVATLGVICAVAAIGLSQIRSESALGRLLIWRASVPMITEAPILGNGHNSFEKNYMFAQADFFAQNPDSQFAQIASNVGYPFNDSLRLLVEQGAVGLILFALLAIALLWPAKNREKLWLQCGLLAFIVYAQFSYPSYITPIMTLAAICAGMLGDGIRSFAIKLDYRIMATAMAIVAIAVGSTFGFWDQSAEQALLAKTSHNHSALHHLKHNFGRISNDRNIFIMYSDASIAHVHNKSQIPTLKEIIPGCNQICTLAGLHESFGNVDEAKTLLNMAANMIPTRLRPQFLLFRLYANSDEHDEALKLAHTIVSAEPKIINTQTIKMQVEAKQYIKFHIGNDNPIK